MTRPTYDVWVECPPGELTRLAQRLRGRRSRRAFLRVVVASGAAMTFGAGVLWYGLREPREYDYAGITCTRVEQLATDYRAGKLPLELRQQIDRHVARCPCCQPRFQQMGLI